MSKIELRLSFVPPPAPDPPRTIYRDLPSLPDPALLGITIRYYNLDDVGLYFRVTGEAPGYTFGTVDLGLLGSGANTFKNLDEFASRAKPSAELSESIKLILRAYTDSGYTNLKWTCERTVNVVWIDSSNPSYTVDVLNDFNDGTAQGWDGLCDGLGTFSIAVVPGVFSSPPYSVRAQRYDGSGRTGCHYYGGGVYLFKTFTTPDRARIYAIFDVRLSNEITTGSVWRRLFRVYRASRVVIQLGWTALVVGVDQIPGDKWIRVVVPLPRNTSLKLTLEYAINYHNPSDYIPKLYTWMHMDDFKIISK